MARAGLNDAVGRIGIWKTGTTRSSVIRPILTKTVDTENQRVDEKDVNMRSDPEIATALRAVNKPLY